jgi:hypothetical protein
MHWQDEIFTDGYAARLYPLGVETAERGATTLSGRVDRDHIQFDVTLNDDVALDERWCRLGECPHDLPAVDFERQIWPQSLWRLIYRYNGFLVDGQGDGNLPPEMSLAALVRVVNVDGGPVSTMRSRRRRTGGISADLTAYDLHSVLIFGGAGAV